MTAPELPKSLPLPITATLPEYLKDPKNFNKIQKAILEAGATRHSHSDMTAWAACAQCQKKAADRTEMMKKLGFKSGKQYIEWKRVHETIKERVPLPKHNS